MWHLPNVFLSKPPVLECFGGHIRCRLGELFRRFTAGWVLMGVSLVAFRYTLSVTVVKADGS